VSRTRVVIYPMPRLLHDILHQLLGELEGVELVDVSRDAGDLAAAASRAEADVVIAGEADAAPPAVGSLLDQVPRARALVVSHDGSSGVVYELRPVRRPLGELSAATLRQVVRAATPSFELLLAEPIPRPAP
jgi:hypothetical protein